MSKHMTAVLILGFCFASPSFARVCRNNDLRNPHTMPVRSQQYVYDGKTRDSRYCYAFTLANIAGHELGVAVDPADIAVQEVKNWPKQDPSFYFPLTLAWGGVIERSFSTMSSRGYCSKDNFSQYLSQIQRYGRDWYPALHDQALARGNGIFTDIDNACSPRLMMPSASKFKYEQNDEASLHPGSLNTQTAQRMMRTIDERLATGAPVALSYQGHYVTIMGQRENCEYIIQDSIPHSIRVRNFHNFYNKTEGEHIQFWTPEELNMALHFPLNTNAIPGIGYVEPERTTETSVQMGTATEP